MAVKSAGTCPAVAIAGHTGSAGAFNFCEVDAAGNLLVSGAASGPNIGAANWGAGQVASSTSAGLLLAARATRTSVSFVNLDTTNTVYLKNDNTVTTSNGFRLKPGESVSFNNVGAFYFISNAGTPTVAYAEEWN